MRCIETFYCILCEDNTGRCQYCKLGHYSLGNSHTKSYFWAQVDIYSRVSFLHVQCAIYLFNSINSACIILGKLRQSLLQIKEENMSFYYFHVAIPL